MMWKHEASGCKRAAIHARSWCPAGHLVFITCRIRGGNPPLSRDLRARDATSHRSFA
jgi:hypothetical protein